MQTFGQTWPKTELTPRLRFESTLPIGIGLADGRGEICCHERRLTQRVEMFFQLGLRIGGCGRKGRAIGYSSLSSSGIDCAKGQQLQRADNGHGVQRQPPFGSYGDHCFGHRRERGQVEKEGAAHLPLGLYALGQVVGIGRKHMKTTGSPQQATHPRVQERRARRSDHHRPPDAGCKDEGIEGRLRSEHPQRGSIGRERHSGRRTTAKDKPFFQKGGQADACRFGIGR